MTLLPLVPDPQTLLGLSLVSYAYLVAMFEVLVAGIVACALWYTLDTYQHLKAIQQASARDAMLVERLVGPVLLYLDITQGNPWQEGDFQLWLEETYGASFAHDYRADMEAERVRLCIEEDSHVH